MFRFRCPSVYLYAAVLAAGCSQQPGVSLIDQVRNADLAEQKPRPVKQANADPNQQPKRQPETFPGDDSFGEQLTSASTTSTSARVPRSGAQAAVYRTRLQQGGDGYQLNFENASLAEVVKVVLGDTLRLPYHYDPRVQGQVTLSTGQAVSREQLLAVLESALKMNNAALIGGDGPYRITPAAEAAAGEVVSVSLNREEMAMPGFGVSVLPLHNVSADAMLRLLENFIGKGGSLRAETTGNLLLERGTANEPRTLMDVAASFDVDWLRGQSARIFPLTHSTPDELINELTQTMQAEQGDLVAKMVRFQPIHRLNAVLVLSRQSSHLKKAAEWIKRLDRTNAAGQSLYVYRVENGKAQDLAALLNDTLGSGTGGRRSRSEVAPGKGVQSLSAKAAQPTAPLTTGALPTQPGQQPGLLPAGAQMQRPPQQQAEPPPSATSASPSPASAAAASDGPIIADEAN